MELSDDVPIKKDKLSRKPGKPEMQELRRLLLGKDYQELLKLKKQLDSPELHSAKVAEVVSEALSIRAAKDESLANALSPVVEGALTSSIEGDPKRLANALYPVMGPAIRKSINEVLSQTLETFNQLLEQSFSPRSLLWRFDAWRTGRSYPEVVLVNTLEYHVEQVFLIHRESGLLLRHVVSPRTTSKDPDMVSGMLTAIQDFISDSFGVDEGDNLSTLRLGELSVQIEQGPHAALAAVVRGNVPQSLNSLLGETQESIHRQMGHTLQAYEGDSEPFVRIHPLLEKCLVLQTQQKKKKQPWLVYLILLGILSGLGYWAYQQYLSNKVAEQLAQQQALQEEQRVKKWNSVLNHIAQEPGVVVIDSVYQKDKYLVRGLLDPLAKHPQEILSSMGNVSSEQVDFVLNPYLSAEPAIVRQRVQQALQPPPGVSLRLDQEVLKVSGKVEHHWYEKLLSSWSLVPGIGQLDTHQLQVVDVEKQKFEHLLGSVQRVVHHFDNGQSDLKPFESDLQKQARNIRSLLNLADKQQLFFQVKIQGRADGTGNQEINQKLARERSEKVKNRLIELGIPAFVLTSDTQIMDAGSERSVRYEIVLDRDTPNKTTTG